MPRMTGIGQPRTIPLDALREYEHNPRRGDVDTIMGSLRANGQFAPLVVNERGGELTVIAGNHTLRALRRLHEEQPDGAWGTAACYVVDVDEQRARAIMLAANRTGDLATYDEAALLAELEALDMFDGTGWAEADLDALEALTQDVEPDPAEDTPDEFPYPGMATVTLHLLPPLHEQWQAFTCGFDSPEEALEHLLDHGSEA